MDNTRKKNYVFIILSLIVLCAAATGVSFATLLKPNETNYLRSEEESEKLGIYEKVNVTDLASLEGRSFAIAGENGNLKNTGVITSGITGFGLSADKGSIVDVLDGLLYTENRIDITFQNGVESNGGYLYELVTPDGKYININNKNVTLEDEPIKVLVRTNQLATLQGQVVISDINKVWCLNWYGGNNNNDVKFAAWNSADNNSHVSLFEFKYSKTRDDYLLTQETTVDVNDLDEKEYHLSFKARPCILSGITVKTTRHENEIDGTKVSQLNGSSTALFYSGYDILIPKFKFELVQEELNLYYISTIVDGVKKYINIDTSSSSETIAFMQDTPQLLSVKSANDSGGINISAVNGDIERYLFNHNSTENFIGYNKNYSQSTITLFNSKNVNDLLITYDVSPTLGTFENVPEIESNLQPITDSSEFLFGIGNEDEHGYFNIKHGMSQYPISRLIEDPYNDTNFFKDPAQNSSKSWGYQLEFKYWKSIDTDGNDCYFYPDEPIETDGEYIYINDIDGVKRKLYRYSYMSAQYRERSNVCLFFLNYHGTVMDGDGTIQNWPVEDFTPLLAIAHVYNADEMIVGTDDLYADEIHQRLTSCFKSSYDENDSGLQIVIEDIVDIDPNNTSRLVSYENKLGIDSEELKSNVLKYLRNENVNIQLSSLHNPKPTASIENLNAKNYDIRWYVLKKSGTTYHIDGVIIAKTENVDVSKNIYNLTETEEQNLMNFSVSDAGIQSYYINVGLLKSTGTESYFDLVTSNEYEEAKQGYYTYYDQDNGNYLWNIELINEEPYILEERNFNVPNKDCVITIDVTYADGTSERLLRNQVNTANVSGVIAGTTIDSIEFNNYYTNAGTGLLYINKIDKDTGAGIKNATFMLKNNETGETYISESDCKGVAFILNLPEGRYKLAELSAPNGYIKSLYEYEFLVEKTEDNTLVKSVNRNGKTTLLYSQKDGIIVPFVVENRKDNNTVVIEKDFKGLTAEMIDSLENYKITLSNGMDTYNLTLDDPNVEVRCDGKSFVWYIDNFNYGTYTLTEEGYDINRYNILPKLTQNNTIIANTTGQEGTIVYNLDILGKNESIIQLENTYTEITNFNYRVEYYYDGVIDDTKTDEFSANYGDIISNYVDKVIPGYKLEREVEPIQITDNEELNVMKVYYIPDDGSTKNIKYTVKYYKDGEEIYLDRIVRTENVQLLEPDTLEVVDSDVNITDKYIGYEFEKMDLNGSEITTVPQTVQDKDIINVYYTKKDYTYTVEYYYNGILDESKTDEFTAKYKDRITEYTDKNIPGYKLERPVKSIIISEDPQNNVMRVYYVIDENNTKIIRYTVNYYKDGEEVLEDRIVRTKTIQVLEPNTIDIVDGDINTLDKYEHYDFYKMYLNKENVDNVDSPLEDKDVIDIYYVRKNCKYTVEYYYDGVLDESKTDEFNAKYGDTITNYKDKVILGYKLERAVEPIQITEDETQNVMRVYYVINENSTKDLKYTVRYFKDGVEVPLDTIVRTKTVQSLQPNTIEVESSDVNITDKYTGYVFDKMELNGEGISDIPQVVNNKDVIDVYYVTNTYKYTVEYYYDGVLDESKTDEFSANYQEVITDYIDKVIPGYKLDGAVTPIVITENEEENVMKVYYIIDDEETKDIKYTVRYFKDEQEVPLDKIVRTETVQILDPDTLEVVDSDVNITDKYIGYGFEKLELNGVEITTVPETVTNNDIIDVYYTRNEYKYTVEYYYNGVIDNSKTDEFSAKYNEIINEYIDKNIPGYKLEREVLPIQITDNPENNVMRVYYIIDNNDTKDLEYTVRYFKDGVEVPLDTIIRGKTVQVLQPDTLDIVSGDINVVDKYVGYRFEKMELNSIQIPNVPTVATNHDVIDVYYVKQDYKYTVEYYYDGVIDDTKTDEFSAKYNEIISEYIDKNIPGYRLEREVLPIQITDNPEQNVMKVYYVRDDSDSRTIQYKVRYFKDGVEVLPDAFIRTKTINVNDPDEIDVDKTEINIEDMYNGYNFEKIQLNDELVESIPDTVHNNDTINVYYVSRKSNIIVKFEDRQGNTIKQDFEVEGRVYEKFNLDTVYDRIEGYTLYEKTEEGITEFEENTKIVIFRYDKNAKVVVKFVDKETGEYIDVNENYELNGVVGTGYITERKSFENYKFIESTNNTSGIMTEEIIEVIYYYEKEEVTPIEPDEPVIPDEPELPDDIEMIDLPDTSDINVVLVTLIFGLSICGIIKYKKKIS